MKSQSVIQQYDGIFNGLPLDFNEYAISLFKYQYLENILYREFADHFNLNPENIQELKQIPFLPVLSLIHI